MQQSRMTFRQRLACQAVQLPMRLSRRKQQRVAEGGSAKMQPKPMYKAERMLTDAGFRLQQAKGLVTFMGAVIEPLALQSPVEVVKRGSIKMQPDPVYKAEQALTHAGFTRRQVRGLVTFVGDVIKPLALQSPMELAGIGGAKFQPEPVFRAERTLTDAGIRPQQAKGLIRFVGNVVKPLAQQSSVLEVQENVEDMDYTFTWNTINGTNRWCQDIMLHIIVLDAAAKLCFCVLDVAKSAAGQ